MIYSVAVLATIVPAVIAGSAEISTGNLNKGASFDNLKASWGRALSLGSHETTLTCNYDYNANKDFLNDIVLSGNLISGDGEDDVSVDYEVTRNLGSKTTDVKLTATSKGATLYGEYNDNSLDEIGASTDLDVGDYSVKCEPSWQLKAQTARVKLMSGLGSDKDSFSATIDYATEDQSTTYEVGYSRDLEDGKSLSATLSPESKDLEIEYTDTSFEDGATWTATANLPLDSDDNIMDSASVTLSRSWDW